MAMRETVNTLRVYFALSGAYALIAGIRSLSLARAIPGILGLCFGIAYLYVSIQMLKLLKDSLGTIKWVLLASSVFLGFALVSALFLGHAFVVTAFLFGIAINWYLYRNATRLAVEFQSLPAVPNAPNS